MDPAAPAGWRPIGSSVNSQYFLGAAEDVLLVLPAAGARDDEASARENVAFQVDHARKLGRRCATVVMMGRLVSQDAGARRVYAEAVTPEEFFATALVVSNLLSRAIGSFFLGLTRPRIPLRMFESFEAALAWIDTLRPPPARP